MRNNLELHPQELFEVVAECFRKEWGEGNFRLPTLATIMAFAEEPPQAPLRMQARPPSGEHAQGMAAAAPAGTAQTRQPQGVRAAPSGRHSRFAASSFAMSAVRSVKRRRRNKSGVGKKAAAAEARKSGVDTDCYIVGPST